MACVITGTWVNKGIGTVQMEKNGLVWIYVAPQLGNWIAAPPPSSGIRQNIMLFLQFMNEDAFQSNTLTLKSKSSGRLLRFCPLNRLCCVNLGFMGLASSMDFISYHTYLLLGILGGTLLIVIGFLSVIVFHCR